MWSQPDLDFNPHTPKPPYEATQEENITWLLVIILVQSKVLRKSYGSPTATLEPEEIFNAKSTNLIIRLPFMRFRPLICFLPLEFSQNWRKMASYMLRGDRENKRRRSKAATGSFITGVQCNPTGEHRAVGAPGWLIHPVGRKGKEEKGHVSRLALKEWEGFP